jgi:hypothetical protein
MLSPASKLKGENDMKKYEKARNLRKHIDHIRSQYAIDMKVRLLCRDGQMIAHGNVGQIDARSPAGHGAASD